MRFLVRRRWSVSVAARTFAEFDHVGGRTCNIVCRLSLLHVLSATQCDYFLIGNLPLDRRYRWISRLGSRTCSSSFPRSSAHETYALFFACLLSWIVGCWDHLYLHGLHLAATYVLCGLSVARLKHILGLVEVWRRSIRLVMNLLVWIVRSHRHGWVRLSVAMPHIATVSIYVVEWYLP
jgi:hypothetical protein